MDDQFPLPSNLSNRAIDASLEARWEDAIKLNRQIIKLDPQNVDALNRQARAYMELGKMTSAKKYYTNALKIDPYNPIALRNLKIIKSFKKSVHHPQDNGHTRLSPTLFLQEPGKTKVVSLLNVAEPQKLSQTYCGMNVKLIIKNRKIIVACANGDYLGVLPDDISHHLIKLLKGGNKFDLFIKAIKVNALSVIIRETFRSKRFKNQPSFLEGTSYLPTSDMITSLDGETDEEVLEESEEQE